MIQPGCLPYTAMRRACDRCGDRLRGRQTRWCSWTCSMDFYRNHKWRYARRAAIAGRVCARCGGHATEVDHIKPRRGWPINRDTCLHHQDNLRALCHDCHVTRPTWDPYPDSASGVSA